MSGAARLVGGAALCLSAAVVALAGPPLEVKSPDGNVRLAVRLAAGRLEWRVSFRGRPVVAPSSLGFVVDQVDLGQGVTLGAVERYRLREDYPWRGVHSRATSRCQGARISVRHTASGTTYTLEVRVFDDGVAFRHLVPGRPDQRRVPDAASTFRLPEGSIVWYHDNEGHYEGVHARKDLRDVPADAWAVPPVTVKLPQGLGYASITEAALTGYSGLVLQADGGGSFRERLGHAPPPSYPFTLRYGKEEAARLAQPAAIEGTISTPWRVVLVGRDLQALVDSDVIAGLAPPADPQLFPDGLATSWIRPGRAVWRYLDGGEQTLAGIKEFSRLAGELGFEYNLVEGFWRRWSDAELRELVEYSAARRVGIWVWVHSRDLRDAAVRQALFERCRQAGIVGVKVDFLDHEHKEVVDHYQAILRAAAESQLMVNFHGANKPTGEPRTWPNELTREGVYGMEHRRQPSWGEHNATVPFTRYLAGHGDYTPVVFGERRKETSWAHQIASAAVFTSPLLVYGGHPQSFLDNPAADVIKSIPAVWDETVVLPVSEIGGIAAFARRSGESWFLAILNGPSARTVKIPLAFLGKGGYLAKLVRDQADDAAAVKIEDRAASRADSLEIALRAGGGFIGRFSPGAKPAR